MSLRPQEAKILPLPPFALLHKQPAQSCQFPYMLAFPFSLGSQLPPSLRPLRLTLLQLVSILGVAGFMQAVALPFGLGKLAFFCLGIQWLAFIPAFKWKTEFFYDLTGSLTFLATIFLSLYAGAWPPHPRQQMASLLIMVWAFRLGYFLFTRIIQHGKDSRFDTVKHDALLFLQYWSVQGLWVFLTCLPVLICATKKGEGVRNPAWPIPSDLVGMLVFLVGMGVEMGADFQKYQWQNDWQHRDEFINTGLWSWSRHPNYAGEMTLHLGVFLLASGSYTRPLEWVCAAMGPTFIVLLLYKVSLPMLEKRANARWKDNKMYKVYMQRTPAILPGVPEWF